MSSRLRAATLCDASVVVASAVLIECIRGAQGCRGSQGRRATATKPLTVSRALSTSSTASGLYLHLPQAADACLYN